MARPLRIQYPGAVYHVMNRGGSRQKVFLEKQDYEAFLKTIGDIHERWGIEVFAYCLLSTTITSVCVPPRAISLASCGIWMGCTHSNSTDVIIATGGKPGAVQGNCCG